MTKAPTQNPTPVKAPRARFRSLVEEVKCPEADVDVMAVILDCTGHYKTNNSFDYVTKVKLIDQTYNPLCKVKNAGAKLEGAVTAYVFSQSIAAAPVVVKVGDVLLLRHVSFSTYRDQVSCKAGRHRAEWAVFDGRVNAPKQPISASANYLHAKEDYPQLITLRNWAVHFFLNNSLTALEWYGSQWPRDAAADKTYQLKDVDIIVKVLGSVQMVVEGQRYQKIAFGDAQRNYYFSELSYHNLELEADMVVKLRSVCILRAGSSMRIDFYNYSSILLLLDTFKDAKTLTSALAQINFDAREIENQFFEEFHLDKYSKRALCNNIFVYELERGSRKVDMVEFFPLLAEFAHDGPGRGAAAPTYVKREAAALPLSSLKELSDLLVAMKKRACAAAADFERLYRVKARVTAAQHDDLAKIAHFYSPSTQRTVPLSAREEWLQGKQQPDTLIAFHNVFQLQDETIGARTLPCYLSTFEGHAGCFFDLWRLLPEVYNVSQWCALKQPVATEFNRKLRAFLAQKAECELALQLRRSKDGKFYFCLADTVLGF